MQFRPRAVLVVLGIIIAAYLLLQIVQAAQGILIWIFVAIFLALALNPAVDALQRRGIQRRGVAVSIVFIGAILVIAALAATFVPTIVSQVNDFIDAVPGYVEDLTKGQGRLGFLEREYQITERVREALSEGGATKVLGALRHRARGHQGRDHGRHRDPHDRLPDPLHAARGAGLDGALYGLLPEEKQPRWRAIGQDIYRTIGGYVTGQPRDQPDRRHHLDDRAA